MGVLACHCIKGPQTFEKLAELMCDVHARFSLEGKIMRTVTDNGANFLKSFRKFGPRSGLAATAHRPPAEDMDDVEEVLPSQPQPQYRNEREDEAPGDHEYIDDEIHLPRRDDRSHPGLPLHLVLLLETAEGGQPWPRGKERQAPATSGFTVALSVAKAVLAATLLQGSGVEAATTEEGRQRRG